MTEQFMCSRYPNRSAEFNGNPFFNRKFFFTGCIQQISPEKYFLSFHFRQRTDRSRTAPQQSGQEIPFNFYTKSGWFMMKCSCIDRKQAHPSLCRQPIWHPAPGQVSSSPVQWHLQAEGQCVADRQLQIWLLTIRYLPVFLILYSHCHEWVQSDHAGKR